MNKSVLNKKVNESIYEIVNEYGDDGEIEGYFNTLEEAKKKCLEFKEHSFYKDSTLVVNELIWNEEEQEYEYQYEGICLTLPVFLLK